MLHAAPYESTISFYWRTVMPYKDVTYENGFTERFYYDETPYEEALRMSRTNSVSKFPSVNSRPGAHQSPSKPEDSEPSQQ